MIETGLKIEIPKKASLTRVLTAELERLHSHLIFFAHAFEVLGHETFCYRSFALREPIQDCLYWLSGNRVHYSVPIIGGIRPRCEVTQWKKDKILPIVTELEGLVAAYADRILADAMILPRIAGVGVLSKEDAEKWNVVGPTGRASGVPFDCRSEVPDYKNVDFNMCVLDSGDTAARVVVRILEVLESIKMVKQILAQMPMEGPIINTGWEAGKMGFTDIYSEAPRGEVYHSYSLDSTGRIRHYKVRTPTPSNLTGMGIACIGDQLTDAVVTIASCDPCLSCSNRVTIVKNGEEKTVEAIDIAKGKV